MNNGYDIENKKRDFRLAFFMAAISAINQ